MDVPFAFICNSVKSVTCFHTVCTKSSVSCNTQFKDTLPFQAPFAALTLCMSPKSWVVYYITCPLGDEVRYGVYNLCQSLIKGSAPNIMSVLSYTVQQKRWDKRVYLLNILFWPVMYLSWASNSCFSLYFLGHTPRFPGSSLLIHALGTGKAQPREEIMFCTSTSQYICYYKVIAGTVSYFQEVSLARLSRGNKGQVLWDFIVQSPGNTCWALLVIEIVEMASTVHHAMDMVSGPRLFKEIF